MSDDLAALRETVAETLWDSLSQPEPDPKRRCQNAAAAVLAALAPHVTAQVDAATEPAPDLQRGPDAASDLAAQVEQRDAEIARLTERVEDCGRNYNEQAGKLRRAQEWGQQQESRAVKAERLVRRNALGDDDAQVNDCCRDALTEAADALSDLIDLDRRVAADVVPWLRGRAAVESPDREEER